MKKFRVSKKFWLVPIPKFWLWGLILSALIVMGLFIFLLFFFKDEPPEDIIIQNGVQKDIQKPVSFIYRYDGKEKEYLSDQGESWQDSTFSRFIYDAAPEGLELDKCYYFFYDNVGQKATVGGERKCNRELTITVGDGKGCPSQEENACTLYVYAIDSAGNESDSYGSAVYHIDWQSPKIGEPYLENKNYLAEVSDNLEVGYCWLYVNGKNAGPMKIKDNLAYLEYPVPEDESSTAFVRCADHYAPERENYLNLASSKLAEFIVFKNHPPEISLCRVNPVKGTSETAFQFEAEAVDPDGDNLFYNWDFGDGESSNKKNPIHYYFSPNTYQPKVIVLDGNGEDVNCSTAWVVVSSDND
ncbi:MAG: PKD domain-containing protein [bacterium]